MAKRTRPNFTDQAAGDIVAHHVNVLRFAEGVREQVVSHLEDLSGELEERVRSANIDGGATPFKAKRTETLLKQTKTTIKSAYGKVEDTTTNELVDLAGSSKAFGTRLLNKPFAGSELASVALTPGDLRALVSNVLVDGAPQKAWWSKQSDDLTQRFAREMRLGMSQGETNDQLVARLRGRRTGQSTVLTLPNGKSRVIPLHSQGIMETSKREATALVRTSAMSVNNAVLNETYEQNTDILKGRQAVATLDTRTSPICRARDGGVWDFKGNPLPESPVQTPWPGPSPWHFQCRTVIVPVTKSWEDLTGIEGLDEVYVPEATRASMDGQVSADQTYDGWLKDQPESVQQDVLGPARWRLWNAGDASLADMVDQSGRALNLGELRARAAGFTTESGIKGEWNGLGAAELIRHAGSLGLDRTQAKDLLARLGLSAADGTFGVQLPKGRKGEKLPEIPDELKSELEGHVEAVKSGEEPPVIIPPPEPVIVSPVSPTPSPAVSGSVKTEDFKSKFSATELVRLAGNQGLSKAEVKQLLGHIGHEVSDATIQTQLGKGRKGEKLPTFDPDQHGRFQTLVTQLRGGTLGAKVVPPAGLPVPPPLKTIPIPIKSSKELRASLTERAKQASVSLEPFRVAREQSQARFTEALQNRIEKLAKEGRPAEEAWSDPTIKRLDEERSAASKALYTAKRTSGLSRSDILSALELPPELRAKVVVNSDDYNPKLRVNGKQVAGFRPDTSMAAKANEAATFLSKLTAKDAVKGLGNIRLTKINERRPFQWEGNIYVTTSYGPETYAHEIGHAIDHHNSEIHQRNLAFLNKRATESGGKLKSLKSMTGKNLRDDEMAWEDKFKDPYTGKDYKGKASEILSTGLEQLYRDPAQFMQDDPEFFDHVVDTLRGV